MSEQTQVAPRVLSDWDILRHQASVLVESKFLPVAVNTWQKATAIMMYGKELGMGPMEALQSIDVIQGKPTQKPQSMKAMVHKKLPGAIFRPIKLDDTEAVYEAARPGDPPVKYSFTMKDAEKLGLTGKDNWKKQPSVMLNWRCVGKVCRIVFPDCLSGVSYSAEEINPDLIVNDEGEVIEKPKESPPPSKPEPKQEAPVVDVDHHDKPEPIPEPSIETIDTDELYTGTPAQKVVLAKLFKNNGVDSVTDMKKMEQYVKDNKMTMAQIEIYLTGGM